LGWSTIVNRTYAFILFLLSVCNLAQAQSPQPVAKPVAQAQVSINLYDQKIYFLGDEIQIRLAVKNTSVDTYQFKIADNRVFSFDFQVTTTTNRPENYHSQKFVSSRNSNGPVFYRDVSLSPGEEYSLVVGFNDFATLPAHGTYNIQVVFFPGLYVNASSPALTSNRLQVSVRPPAGTTEQRSAAEAQIEKDAQRAYMPPDEVVAFMLNARKVDHWDKFFLYINLRKLYINSYLKTTANIDPFNRLSEEEKLARIAQYKKLIMEGKAEWYLMLRTNSFIIQNTSYSRFEATVKVYQEYQHPDYKEPRYYTYTLRRDNETNTWEITDYIIENANTGK